MIEQLSVGGASLYLTQVERGTSPLRDNFGLHVGDNPVLVHQRRVELSARIGRPVLWMEQTHSARVATVTLHDDTPAGAGTAGALIDGEYFPFHLSMSHKWPQLPCDGIIVDARRWPQAPAAAVMTADCMPVIFSADQGRVIAAVHAGRMGFESGILLNTLEKLADMRLREGQISVYIAPAICGHCYEVPAHMRKRLSQLHPDIAETTRWGTPALDLPRAAAAQLRNAGCVNVTIDGRCTLEETQYHSHRRDPRSGRQAAVIVPT